MLIVYLYRMSKKRSQILKTSKELFWKYGIKRVTIEEICTRSGVSKMTFYKHFSNKNDLVKKILDKLYGDAMGKYKAIMTSGIEFKEKVTMLYKLKLDATNEISHEFLNDFYDTDNEELKDYLNSKIEYNIRIIIGDFFEARNNGEIRKDIKPEFINYLLNHMVKMVDDPTLNSLYPDAQDMILEITNFFFYGILPRSESEK